MKQIKFSRMLIAVALIVQPLLVSAGINFKQITFTEAKKLAAKENKLVFVDAYATWCGPCKWLSANVFTDEQVGALFAKTFISIKVDMEKEGAEEIDQLYEITAYPTLLAIKPDGSLVRKQVGALDAEELINWVDICLHPENAPYQKKLDSFNKGNRELSFLIEFLVVCVQEDMSTDFLIPEIYKVMPVDSLVVEENLIVFKFFPAKLSDPHGKFFIQNFQKLQKLHGELALEALSAIIDQELVLNEVTKQELVKVVEKTLASDVPNRDALKKQINEFE